MKKHILLILLMLSGYSVFANDGAFFAKGNQLIPINETDITVRKEILTLKKIRNQFIEVTVYYEFFNPKEDKKITVGFEAFSPEGDVDGSPKNGKHPYMRDFTVELNNSILKYDVAYVSDSLYNKNGTIKSLDMTKFDGNKSGNYVDFFYVYHFEANFKKGLNIVKHTYNYDLSGSIDYNYDFEYVLTAANRWANKQIDDFTLIIDNGEFETFSINKTFFKTSDEWLINGIGKTEDIKGSKNAFVENDALKFHLQKGNIIFQKKNFKVNGDLFLYAQNYLGIQDLEYIPFSYYQEDKIVQPKNDFQRKVLKNLPFARRGYVFQNQDLNQFYKKMDWYIPNPNYQPNAEILTDGEKKWIEKWK
ncbi:YARHG domain-containing protein [Epilithonimonas hungarica]|uniref:YARHG domain-containing protein n=1 Tax=Epilithonimonas hungarica TaxID=454006 RepID=A0A1G7UDR6_9FLAO|nr:YARHG domain-containing protein [Epilithonimonas hungarica]SDG45614.1 YARHG domain-containing protein [Epilithonimonas hungarica]